MATLDQTAFEKALGAARTNTGEDLLAMSARQPLLVVFLRHSGCPFCLEAMHDLKKRQREIAGGGAQVVLVHMGVEPDVAAFFEVNGAGEFPRVSDPQQALYRAFGLRRGNAWQLYGPKVWLGVFRAALVGKRVGKRFGDAAQMPGSFLVSHGRVVASFRHASQSDRPDYVQLACAMPTPGGTRA